MRIDDGYRNGPARHELGGQRYGHRWDGDGMVQAFRFGSKVSHVGKFTRTASEELLALWEPGSAYRIDPNTLETIGLKTWQADLRGVAFSAHPKREPDGVMWNFGANPLTGALTLYCIGVDGSLVRSHTLQVDNLPAVHDFAVTERHLVFVLPPMPVNKDRLAGSIALCCASAEAQNGTQRFRGTTTLFPSTLRPANFCVTPTAMIGWSKNTCLCRTRRTWRGLQPG